MWRIILAFVISAAGFAINAASQQTTKIYDDSNKAGIVFGLGLQLVAVIVLLWGMKKYFTDEIVAELKKLNAPK